jgi:hypothetical protein
MYRAALPNSRNSSSDIFRGAKRIRRDAQGDLVLKMGEGEVRWQKPVVYQEKNGTRQEITAHYVLLGTNRVYMVVQASRCITTNYVVQWFVLLRARA